MAEVVLTSSTRTLALVQRDSLEALVKAVSLSMAKVKRAAVPRVSLFLCVRFVGIYPPEVFLIVL